MKYNLGKFYFLVVYLHKLIMSTNVDPFITGGDLAMYNVYPHSVFLVIDCNRQAICGGSVLNQEVVLTAAHCLDSCLGNPTGIDVRYGHEEIKKMNKTKAKNFMNHQKYQRSEIMNDISVVITQDRIPLDDVVKRVILMRDPPDDKKAYVAGWGLDETKKRSKSLRHVSAIIQSRELCRRKLMAEEDDLSILCAGPVNDTGAADRGDSGSALIIQRFVQVGIVSYQIRPWTLVVYTNVSYFLDWIQDSAKMLYCDDDDDD